MRQSTDLETVLMRQSTYLETRRILYINELIWKLYSCVNQQIWKLCAYINQFVNYVHTLIDCCLPLYPVKNLMFPGPKILNRQKHQNLNRNCIECTKIRPQLTHDAGVLTSLFDVPRLLTGLGISSFAHCSFAHFAQIK